MIYDVIVLGSGPAGCTAALYSVRAGLTCLIIEGPVPGGQLTTTTEVVNYPGFEQPIQGPWLIEEMKKQAIYHGAEVKNDWINKVDFSKSFMLFSDNNTYLAKTVIICTGSKAKYLNIPSEEYYLGYGVSACATCDGFFFKNKDVAVIGGGNTAVEECLYLSKICKSVTLIHRRDSLRAEKTLQKELFKKTNISFKWNSELIEVLGDKNPKSVHSIIINNNQTNIKETLNIDGVFIAIGHVPQTDLFKNILNLDSHDYIITNNTKTNIPGIFAAGDVQDPVYRQAVTAAGTGCIAALEAQSFLNK